MNFEPEDDDDDFGDDDGEFPTVYAFETIEAKPITKYTFIHFFLTIIVGFLRTLLEATANLGDAVLGEEVFTEEKKQFEDDARLSIDMIADGTDGEV